MKRILALIAAGAIAATVAGGASAKGSPSKGSFTSDIFTILQPSLDFNQVVTEKGLGKAPVTFSSSANGFEQFFCPDGAGGGTLVDNESWSSSDSTTVTPDKSKASGTLNFSRLTAETSLSPCSDGSTPYVGYILWSGISVTDNLGNTLNIPDQSQGTRA